METVDKKRLKMKDPLPVRRNGTGKSNKSQEKENTTISSMASRKVRT